MSDFPTINAAAAVLWLVTAILALTASTLTAYTVGSIRGTRQGWELFAGLATLSIFVPAALVFVATRLPPDVFNFLRP